MSISKKRVVSTLLTAATTIMLSGAVMIAPAALAYDFTRSLTVGSTGADVMALQQYLNGAGFQIAASGAGSPGSETSYFGGLTKAAVAKWQAANGVTPSVGYFGSISRAKYASLTAGTGTGTLPAGCTSTVGYSSTTGQKCDGTTTTVIGKGVTVAAGVQPANSLAVDNATRLPFTVVKFTASSDGDVTIDSLTVERTGLANDAAFSGAVLLDENGVQLGVAKSLNSSHQAILTEDFVVKAGQTRIMTIAANRADTAIYAGQVASFSLVSVVANATVNGTLPIVGASHTINESLVMGTITMNRGSIDPGTGVTKEVGTTGYTFSAVKVTAGSAEDVILKSIRFNQTGSAGSGDFANLKIYVDGTAYDVTVSSDGKYYTATFGTGLTIAKGFSKEISIKGDIVGGSGRTIDFDIAKRTDLNVVGAMYGYGITPPQTGATVPTVTASSASAFSSSEDPWYAAARVTVSAGSMTVSTSNTVAASNIAVNLTGQSLAAFTADVKGEAISVSKVAFNVTIGNLTASSETVANITNATLYDENGAVVAGPVDGTTTEGNTGGATGVSHGEIIFSDSVTFPVGTHTYTLKAKIGTDFDTNDTITASTTPRNFSGATGQTTNTSISIDPNSVLTFPAMTVKAGALTISVSTVPIAQTVIANASQFTFANYILDATASGEDVRITSLPLEYNVNTSGQATSLTNCKLYDGSTALTTGSNTKSPSAAASSSTFTIDGNGLTVSKGTSKTIALKCDVSGSATANAIFYWGIDGAADMTSASGLTSGQTIGETINDAIGQAMTVQTGGSLTVALDTASPLYTIVADTGTADVELARVRFSASNEDIDLKQIALQLTDTASNTPIDLIDRKVTLWDGATQVGSATFPTGDNATSSAIASGSFRIPRDSSKVLIIKGDIAGVSVSGPLTVSGDLLKVDYDGTNNGLNGNYGTGVSSGSTITPSSADTASNGVRIMKALPTFTKLSVPSTNLVAGTAVDLYRFSLAASPSGAAGVGLYKLTINMATSSGAVAGYGSPTAGTTTVTNVKVYAYTDSGFSSPVAGSFTNGQIVTVANSSLLASGDNDAPLLSVLQIPGGSTYYFRVTGDVALVAGSGTFSGSITTRISGDSAYANESTSGDASGNMFTALGVDSDSTDDNFIWSPSSTTSSSAAAADLDWANGYRVSGLPSDGSDAVTIYK